MKSSFYKLTAAPIDARAWHRPSPVAVVKSRVPAARDPTHDARPRKCRSGTRRPDPPSEDLVNRQQFEVDRLVAQSRRMGCESSGFFSIFSNPPAQCGPLAGRSTSSAALERMRNDLERLNGGTTERAAQRQALLIALGDNGCGPQYRSAALAGQQNGFFDRLFGGNGSGVYSTPRARWAALSAPFACARVTAFISRSRTRRRQIVSATTNRPASACARRQRCRSTPITIPARK